MTIDELEVVIKEADNAYSGPNGEPLCNPNTPVEVANFRASLEVAYQLAILNERLDMWGTRNSTLRVMVEPGEWPIQTQERNR